MEVILGIGVLAFFGLGFWWSSRPGENEHKARETEAARYGG